MHCTAWLGPRTGTFRDTCEATLGMLGSPRPPQRQNRHEPSPLARSREAVTGRWSREAARPPGT
eukprot:2157848-Prorocentrum_lima.AAC.1